MRIHTRLAWLTLIISLIALGSATLLWNDALRRERTEELNERLLDQARMLSALLPDPRPVNEDAIDELVKRMHRETRSRITVIVAEGTVLAESDLDRNAVKTMENHADRPEVREALEWGVGRSSRYSATLGLNMAYVAIRWGPSDEPHGVVRAALPMTRVMDEQSRGRNRLFLVLAGSLVLAGILGTVASRRVSHPLARISAGARAIGAGDLNRRLEVEGPPETRNLAMAVNHLADSLQAKIKQVEGERSRLAQLLEGMPDGILALDHEGRITLINEAARQIFSVQGDPEGAVPVEAVRNSRLQEAVDQALADNEPRNLEIELVQPEPRNLAVALVPIAAGVVVVVHDITRLRRLEGARREMVANVGHELRTPLAAILGYLETLESGDVSPDERSRFLEVIHRNARRLERLVRDLSRLSRLESPETFPDFRPVSIPEIISGVIDSLGPRAEAKQVAVIQEIEPGIPAVRGDRHGLETVLLNLLDNAVRVTDAGDSVALSARGENGFVRISVQDAGPGIPVEYREKVFERFFRIDQGRTAEQGGTGLGLAIVKHTVLQHGGEVWIEGEDAPGARLVFTVPVWRESV